MKTYLALGDSYTIGEQVLLSESFPYQTVQLLRNKNIEIAAPEIIAKTGWTTSELLNTISKYTFLPKYDFVSLIIGVNNQYDGIMFSIFEKELEALILKSISLTKKSEYVFVLSIPDWGVTPYAIEKDIAKIAKQIDMYNDVCKKISLQYNCTFIDITSSQRVDAKDAEMYANDGLHPSAKEYSKWAQKLADVINGLHSL